MAGVHPLVALAAGGADDLPQHAVVLEVVHGLEQSEPDEGLDGEVGQDPDAKPGGHGDPQRDRHEPRVQHVVADPDRVPVAECVAAPLDAPGAGQRPEHRARPEPVEALAEPAAGGIRGRGDAHVVTAVVLDVEVAVEGLGKGDLRQPALHRLPLVAELVSGVDAEPPDEAHRDREPHLVDGREIAPGDEPEGGDEAGVLDREEQVGDPPVVAVLLERRDEVVGRVRSVESGDHVDDGHQSEDDDRPEPQPHAPPGEGVERDRREGQARHDEGDQPQVPLAIAPADRRSVPDRARRIGGLRHRASSLPWSLQKIAECKPRGKGLTPGRWGPIEASAQPGRPRRRSPPGRPPSPRCRPDARPGR